jgi:hypothetical protein
VAEGTKPTTMRKLLEENDRLRLRNGELRIMLEQSRAMLFKARQRAEREAKGQLERDG